MAMPPAFIGIWKYQYSAEMRGHWERHFRAQLSNDADVAEALAAVDAEAAGAEIEIAASGEIASRSGGAEFYRARLAADDDGFWFDKPNGQRVSLRLSASGEIHAEEPGKPVMVFRRIA
jgi:hypothetical protein